MLRPADRQPASKIVDGIVTEQEYAERIGVCLATVRRRRKRREGPTFIQIGRDFYTTERRIENYVDALFAEAEGGAGSRRRGRRPKYPTSK